LGLALAMLVIAGGGFAASRAHFATTPQTLFSEEDEVGRTLSFFDRRFGGPDYIQVGFHGDLRDPAVAARLLRFTDLLEGSGAFSDVRSVAQILAFLGQGFVGVQRIPTARESLGSLWFFLEGRPDVRNLASDQRDEAVLALRVPSRPAQPMAGLVAEVKMAAAASLATGVPSARMRLLALGRAFHLDLPPAHVDEVLAAAMAPITSPERSIVDAEARTRLHTWAASSDSPYQPTDAEWRQIETALDLEHPARGAALAVAAAAFPAVGAGAPADQFANSVLTREKDLRFSARVRQLAGRLAAGAPEAFLLRAQGVLADLLDPHAGKGESAKVVVSGLPVVAGQMERDLLAGWWKAIGLLLALGAFGLLVLRRRPVLALRALVEASTATALAIPLTALAGSGIDSGSAALLLLCPLAALLVSAGGRGSLPLRFLVAIGAAGLPLMLFGGAAPIHRAGAALLCGSLAVALVTAASERWLGRSETEQPGKTASD